MQESTVRCGVTRGHVRFASCEGALYAYNALSLVSSYGLPRGARRCGGVAGPQGRVECGCG